MTIDPVAVYAAVVATGALGWQVFSWRYQQKGRLEVSLMCQWRGPDDAWLHGWIMNANDYP